MILNEKARTRLKEFLALPCGEATEDPRLRRFIQEWAQDPDYGSLPDLSGRHFANWLDNVWENWTEEPEQTVGDVLEGAVSDWCGGRTF